MHSPRRGKPAPLRLKPIRDARDRDRAQQREGERQYECRRLSPNAGRKEPSLSAERVSLLTSR